MSWSPNFVDKNGQYDKKKIASFMRIYPPKDKIREANKSLLSIIEHIKLESESEIKKLCYYFATGLNEDNQYYCILRNFLRNLEKEKIDMDNKYLNPW